MPRSALQAAAARDTDREALSIDRDAEVPLGVQLAWTLRARIGVGEFKAGQRLPGLRELAETIGVNLNTVRTVYQRLENEGLIESQQGSGTFVARTPSRGSAVVAIATTAAHTALETGVDPREVAAALYVHPAPPSSAASEAADLSEIGQRRLLRRQIAAFESALAEIEAAHPGVAPAAAPTNISSGPTLLGTAELEQVRTSLVRRLAVVQSAIDAESEARSGEKPPRARVARAEARDRGAAPAGDAARPPRRPRTAARALPAGT